MATDDGHERIDGRGARRDRNRAAVVAAVVALFEEGVLAPDPEEVAARSSVSVRSVYRYFEDRDDLLLASLAHHQRQYAHLGLISEIGQGTLEDRIDRFLDSRLALHETIGATARTARALARGQELHRRQLDRAHANFRRQVELQFAPELKAMGARRRKVVEPAVDVLCQFESLDLLRLHRGLTARETRRVLAEMLATLLQTPIPME